MDIRISKKTTILILTTILFIIGFFLIQSLDTSRFFFKLNEQNISYSLLFIIGMLVSFHCVGMCGGLIATYSLAQKEKKWQPHLFYNLGRLLTYTAIGGLLGGLGATIAINSTFTSIITFLAGLFMLVMGLSLLTNWHFINVLQARLPNFLNRFLYQQIQKIKNKGPFLLGIANGLMPCGPLQAMQLYALGSGSVWRGALAMFLFCLGTVPLMFGFGRFVSLVSSQKIKYILQISGLIIIILGFLMINRGLVNFGFHFPQTAPTSLIVDTTNKQVISMEVTGSGYTPDTLNIKKDIPVVWKINVVKLTGCNSELLLPDYGIKKKLQLGENIIEFTPNKSGEALFSCGMKMLWGKFIIN